MLSYCYRSNVAGSQAEPQKSMFDMSSAAAFCASMEEIGLAAMVLNLVGLGEELDLFKKLVNGPMKTTELAAAAGCDNRYVKEWCLSMLSVGVLAYDDGKYSIPKSITDAVTAETTSFYATFFAVVCGDRAKLASAFKTGDGIDSRDRDPRVAKCWCTFFKPLYERLLVPCLTPEIKAKLEAGGRIADVGCGLGVSACILAEAFPKAEVRGIDYCATSIEQAKTLAVTKQLTNVSFSVDSADSFGPSLTKDDVVALPTAHIFLPASVSLCLPCAKMNGGDGLGTVTPTVKFRTIFLGAGFSTFESVPCAMNADGFRLFVAKKE
ncbi:hypothetical protein CTAYLR_006578 [Chrysophaeum taylorii]|uniref:Methyltransferase domain-containing protein n=1 Tax=Chrysophaeum taylorii TaxID=2483200 RepID=A0AAD7UMP0_9STRA|nr:hypothetical protein CTAYLR_006578 [Chrysophaeum taylorii]